MTVLFTNQCISRKNVPYVELLVNCDHSVTLQALEDGGSSQAFTWLTFSYDRFNGDLSEEALMKNYGLLACFKKDMHKVETYLKVMNCKRFAESNCTV